MSRLLCLLTLYKFKMKSSGDETRLKSGVTDSMLKATHLQA